MQNGEVVVSIAVDNFKTTAASLLLHTIVHVNGKKNSKRRNIQGKTIADEVAVVGSKLNTAEFRQVQRIARFFLVTEQNFPHISLCEQQAKNLEIVE